MCYSIVFIENCMSLASILTIFMISLERFYVICQPLKVKQIMTHSHTLIVIAFIWIISIIVNLPFVFLAEYKLTLFFDNNKYEYKCSSVAGSEWMVVYSVTVTFFVFVIIGLVLFWMFHNISVSLKESTKAFLVPNTISNQQSKKSLNSQKTHENELIPLKGNELNAKLVAKCHNSSPTSSLHKQEKNLLSINSDLQKYIKPRRQLIKMLMCVIIVFYICFFPLKIWVLILMFFGSRPWFLNIIQFNQYWYVSITCRIFFYANSSLNPVSKILLSHLGTIFLNLVYLILNFSKILYNCLSKKFRGSFKRLFLFRVFSSKKAKTLDSLFVEKTGSSCISKQK